MADPVTLAVVGTSVMVGGSIIEGESKAAAHKANANNAYYQAQLSEQQAAERAARIRLEGRRVQGAARAAVGASGVRIEGTPLQAMADSAQQNELEALSAIYQGDLEAYSYRVQAANEKAAAHSAHVAEFFNVGTSILSGFNQVKAGSGTTSKG